MELKQPVGFTPPFSGIILIVPYGIETELFGESHLMVLILIVPYGIETLVVNFVKPL